jgi:hypothetical protein
MRTLRHYRCLVLTEIEWELLTFSMYHRETRRDMRSAFK